MKPGDDEKSARSRRGRRGASPRRGTGRPVWVLVVGAFALGAALAVLGAVALNALLSDDSSPPAASDQTSPDQAPTSSAAATPTEAAAPTTAESSAPVTTAAEAADPVETTAVPTNELAHVQWEIFELLVVAEQEHAWNDFPLSVEFVHEDSGQTYAVDGFWDGGPNWRVRFAPPALGRWTWRTSSSDPGLDGTSGALVVQAPFDADVARNPNYRGTLRVAADQRHLERADGSPFPVLGDTAWWLNSTRCPASPRAATNDLSCGDYFEFRAAQGFTTIALELFNIHNENEGGFPFPCNTEGRGNGNYSCLNPDHFQSLDTRMRNLWSAGLVGYANLSWLVGQQPNEETRPGQAMQLGRYAMARYGWMPMIWSLSGEYQYGYDDLGVLWTPADWNAYGADMASRNVMGHPLTVHPSSATRWEFSHEGAGLQSSGGEFHASEWLSMNSIQSGQRVDRLPLMPTTIAADRAREPVKPVLHAEGSYLEHQVEFESPTSAQLRWQAYVPFLSGAAGHITGANGIWQMYTGPDGDYPENPDFSITRVWWDVMRHPSGEQIGRVRAFYEDVVGPWWQLQPRRQWLSLNDFDYVNGETHPHMAVLADLSVMVVYFGDLQPRNQPTVAADASLAGRTWTVEWFDPVSGERTTDTPITGAANGALRFPDRPAGRDWLMVLRAAQG